MFEDLFQDIDRGDMDFNPDDFSFDISGFLPDENTRILQPRMDIRELTQHVTYDNARQLAERLDLDRRTFCWVSGSFIFGDIIEALMVERGVRPRNLYLCSLSISRENIDSLRTCLDGGGIEKLVLCLSGYFYSHEKGDLVPYLYDRLDVGEKTQVAFGNYHCKIITFETFRGNTLTLHGSANLRSSRSIEQIMIEPGRDLYEFNRDIMQAIADKFGTINHNVSRYKLQRMRGEKSWQAVLSQAGQGGTDPAEAEAAEAVDALPGETAPRGDP